MILRLAVATGKLWNSSLFLTCHGRLCSLSEITVFTDDGRINDNGAQFKGMMRFDAREAIVAELQKLVWLHSCVWCLLVFKVVVGVGA